MKRTRQLTKRLTSCKGATLVEVLVTTAILVSVLVVIMRLFIYCTTLSTLSATVTLSMAQAQDKIEEIREYDFDDITTDYAAGGTPGNIFALDQLNGMGVIYLNPWNADLLEVKVVICWEDKDGRIIGEDTDLDGTLDTGEDQPPYNSEIDSIVSITSLIARK